MTTRMDVFFCTLGYLEPSQIRMSFASACRLRWWEEYGIEWHAITPADLDCTPREFQRERRIWAEEHAAGPYYIVADGDCLLQSAPILPEMRKLMDENPNFAILSLMPENCFINRWTPEFYEPVFTDEVMEHHSVGTVRVCRKGAMPDWPPMDPSELYPAYDRIQCERLREAGFRVGFARNVKMNHLGEGFSSVWR